MSNPTTLATEYFDAFITIFSENDEIIQAALDDLQAVRERVSKFSHRSKLSSENDFTYPSDCAYIFFTSEWSLLNENVSVM